MEKVHFTEMFIVTLFLSLNNSYGRNALEYFLRNKNIKNFTITILPTNNDYETTRWIEYDYYFEQENITNVSTDLLVGLYLSNDTDFDCRLTDSNVYKGYSIDIIALLQQVLNLRLKYVIINETSQLEHELQRNQIHLAICHNHDPRLSQYLVNISQPIQTLQSKYILIYKPEKLGFSKDIFVLTFAGPLWLVFLIFLIVLAICLQITTKYYSKYHPEYEAWTWIETTLWAIAAACQQGLSYTAFGFASCCIFLVGYITAYLLYTGFAASITSLLFQHDAYYKLDVLKISGDLHLKVFKYYIGDEEFLLTFKTISYVDRLDVILHLLDEQRTIALVPEILINQYLSKNIKLSELNEYSSTLLPQLIYSNGFLISRNDNIMQNIQKQLLKFKEKGLLENMLSRNLQLSTSVNGNRGYSSAEREHVSSAFYVLLTGILISFLILILELSISSYKKYRQHIHHNITKSKEEAFMRSILEHANQKHPHFRNKILRSSTV